MATKKKAVPKGYHRMPNGSIMKGARHKAKTKTKRKSPSY